jgi:hypothetical protein
MAWAPSGHGRSTRPSGPTLSYAAEEDKPAFHARRAAGVVGS